MSEATVSYKFMLYISFLQQQSPPNLKIWHSTFLPFQHLKISTFNQTIVSFYYCFSFLFFHGYIFVPEWCVIKGTVDGFRCAFCGVFGLLLNTLLCLVDCAVRALLWARSSTEGDFHGGWERSLYLFPQCFSLFCTHFLLSRIWGSRVPF